MISTFLSFLSLSFLILMYLPCAHLWFNLKFFIFPPKLPIFGSCLKFVFGQFFLKTAHLRHLAASYLKWSQMKFFHISQNPSRFLGFVGCHILCKNHSFLAGGTIFIKKWGPNFEFIGKKQLFPKVDTSNDQKAFTHFWLFR